LVLIGDTEKLEWMHETPEKNLFGQTNTKDNRTQFSLGVAYTLPMLIILQTEVYHDGNVRVQLMTRRHSTFKKVRACIYGKYRQRIYGRFELHRK
jgi:hypothetical protein